MVETEQAVLPVESELTLQAPDQAPQPAPKRGTALSRALLWLAGPLLLAAALWLLALPLLPSPSALAAVVLEYFNVVPSSSAVLLEWSTLSEYNLRGFEVLCKKDGDAESAYHRIAFFNPKGNASQGAQYDMLVTDLQPDVAYCFRLVEVTTDGTPGEERERCGYGLGMTPTPALAASAPPTTTVGITPTIVLFPTPTLPFGITPTVNPFFQQQSPLITPTPPTGATPLGVATTDPALAALQQGIATIDPAATPTSALVLADPFATPPIDPALAANPAQTSPLATPLPTATPVLMATPTLTVTATLTGAPLGDAGDSSAALAPLATPTSLYEIVTATPVPALANAGAAPAVTPWPTATPPASLLGGMLEPTAQNLTVMLLCFIFLSASALGGLGLVTSVLWMRSRSQRDLDELRWRARLDRDRRRI